jgi:MarR family transcriptional regulator, organic hydroperoxide resistance regulator
VRGRIGVKSSSLEEAVTARTELNARFAFGPREEEPLNLGPVLDFMRVLWAVDHELQTASKRMHATRGVTGPQRLVLRIAALHPGVSAGELASILHLHPSTLTGILRRLAQHKLLRRSTDEKDGRRALFVLTPTGHDLVRTPAGTVEAAVRTALGRLSPGKVSTAAAVLGELAKELARYGKPAAP